jgi:hypothetical protein
MGKIITMKYCSRCIMPENYPGISFNDDGICNFCLGSRKSGTRGHLGKEKLVSLLSTATGKGEYDCIIPLSGGKDSTYMLYYAVKVLGLRTLAVTYESGFQTEIAKENMENACRKLGVPLIRKRPPGDVKRRLIRQTLLISEALGTFFATCGDCEAMIRTAAMGTAREYGAPFVLWGSSSLESGGSKMYEKYKKSNSRLYLLRAQFKGMHLSYGRLVTLAPRLAEYLMLVVSQRLAMGIPHKYAFNPLAAVPFSKNNPNVILFFDYIDWDTVNEVSLLRDELGWKHPQGRETRFDCHLHCFGNYKSLKANHISMDGLNYCRFIRESKISRQDAQRSEAEIQKTTRKECEYVIRKVGIKKFRMP